NFYRYSDLDEDANFTITVNEFGAEEGSLVSGTFSGTLFGSLLNGETSPDSVVITQGKFTVIRSDPSPENPF
ncbi:MAG: hypothetical protein AAF551_14345, partial [Bacteroidota bacterium]